MPLQTRTINELEALRFSELPVVDVVVSEVEPYQSVRQWGAFDDLSIRAIDDIWFSESAGIRSLIVTTGEPCVPQEISVIPIPTAIALERAFFHIQEISRVVFNPRSEVQGASELQQRAAIHSLASSGDECILTRGEIPLVLGMLAVGKKRKRDPLSRARHALREGSLFEAFYLARWCREQGSGDTATAWFIELLSLSFLGLPEESLELYEAYPERGGSSPMALLLSARFRLLMKQMNEARTILHTLTFNDEIGAYAACELARSYNASGDFNRAVDAATLAISKDGEYAESYLVRGIAHRGLAYPSGDEDGLQEALQNFEVVAKRGGFGAAEASFHAGTVFGRLGALDAAETSLRQSLFQRDRFSARDALVRVLSAAGHGVAAEVELRLLEKLAPTMSVKLREDVAAHLASAKHAVAGESEAGIVADIWSSDFSVARVAASRLVESWKLPVNRSLEDFAILDDFINRFAPAGDFPTTGEWAALGMSDVATVARVLALYLGDVLVERGSASWADISPDHLVLSISSGGHRIPIEAFVRDRILLGASGDNFSSLESLVAELRTATDVINHVSVSSWWTRATAVEESEFARLAVEGRKRLVAMGAELHGHLGDLEEIDRVIEACFEPGGTVKPGMEPLVGDDVEAFVLESAMYLGGVIQGAVAVEWFSHQQPEGISLFQASLGRVFPVSKLQRRVYLASAADFAVKLSGFAFGVAAVGVQEGIRAGTYVDVEQVRDALIALLPSIKDFPEAELTGVAQSLFGVR